MSDNIDITGYHFTIFCVNRKHHQLENEAEYITKRPFWKESCRNYYTAYNLRQLENFIELVDMRCTCTQNKRCRLCSGLTQVEFYPALKLQEIDVSVILQKMSQLEDKIIELYCNHYLCCECAEKASK